MKKHIQLLLLVVICGLIIFWREFKGTNQPVVSSTQNSSTTEDNNSSYRDGTYTGSVEDALYGNLQVQAAIHNGLLTDVIFLKYPNDNATSQSINNQASVYLKQEAIKAQSAQVDIVSGATDSSQAFQKSLSSALAQAK